MIQRLFATLTLLLLAPAPASAVSPPRLLLVLTVDQGRGDYLERFRPAFEGGLARLAEEGVVFTNAHQEHAVTVTAAGHASLSTGYYPAHSGMVANEWYDRGEARHVYCVDDPNAPILPPGGAKTNGGAGRSPARLLVQGLGDWLKSSSPGSMVFSIGAKDRAAILMGGKHPDGAYWYDVRSGQWVTSRYYAEAYPSWIVAFHHLRLADRYFGRSWRPLGVGEARVARMKITPDAAFSHALGRARLFPDSRFYAALYNSPFIDAYLFELAKALVTEEELGQDDAVDILSLSFASPDTVGHEYGPNSREILDTLLRLDRELGGFFDFLDEAIGLDRVAVSLSADHGVAPLPEYQSANGLPGGRLDAEDFVCFQNAGRRFQDALGHDDWFADALTFDPDALARRHVDRTAAEAALASELSRCPRVERVWTSSEIEAASSSSPPDPMLELYRHSFHPGRSPDLYVQYEKGYLLRSRGTTHGTPYPYDTHVLAVLRWPGLAPKTVTEKVHTVDLPVTLAALAGIEAPADTDGVDLTPLLRGAGTLPAR